MAVTKVRIFPQLKEALEGTIAFEQGRRPGLRVTQIPPPPRDLRPKEIRAIRRLLGMSQAQFARLINVSSNTVESWEQGARRPREATLKLLAIAKKQPEALLTG